MDFSALSHDPWFLFSQQGIKSLRKRIHAEHSLVWICSSGCAGCPELGRCTLTGTREPQERVSPGFAWGSGLEAQAEKCQDSCHAKPLLL